MTTILTSTAHSHE